MKGKKVLVFNEEAHEARKEELMKKWYECFAENGLSSTGIRTLGKSCGCNPSTLYLYFKDLDDLIILGILFFLYQQNVKDEMLYIILFLLLFS